MDADNSKVEKPQLSPLSLTNADNGEKFDIVQETLIGREVECNISLDSPHISRYHAKIIVGADGATIEDLNSSNGTFVNGKRIKERTKVGLGDEISFDDLSFRLTSKDTGTSDATVVLNRTDFNPQNAGETLKQTPARKTPEPDATPASEEADEDSTRMLSSEQINNIAEINKKLQKFTDIGSGPRFVAMTAPIRGKVFELDTDISGNTWRFGRSRECELCVSAPSISRHHGTIRKENGRFYFATAANKTLRVNGEETSDVMLKHNDEIQIGPIEFIFRLDEQKKVSRTVIPEPEPDFTRKQILTAAGVGGALITLLVGFLFLNRN